MNLKLLNELAASNDRSFKFTALGASFALREGRMEGRVSDRPTRHLPQGRIAI